MQSVHLNWLVGKLCFASLLWLTATVGVVSAQPGRDKDPLSWDRNMHAIFRKYCYKCHNELKPSADVNLAEDEDLRLIRMHRDRWERVREVVASGEMPPEDARQPSSEDLDLMGKFLDEVLAEIDCSTEDDAGPAVLRRLNRVEYQSVVNDVLGFEFDITSFLSPDPNSYGFDNNGESLVLTPQQLEQYRLAANAIMEQVIQRRDSNSQTFEFIFGAIDGNADTYRQTLLGLITKLFRGHVSDDLIEKRVEFYREALSEGHDDLTVRKMIAATLFMSPEFLMRIEQDRPEHEGAYLVSDYELANRLSFFLWSTAPDGQLMELAAIGKLQDEEELRRQVERMLRDDRSRALVENFFGQWLGFRELSEHAVNTSVYPYFDEPLRAAMKEEVSRVLDDIVKGKRTIMSIVDDSTTYVNPRLANHYGIDVIGTSWEQVAVDAQVRGGVLFTSAILMMQSDPGRSNIPRRGTFIADRILGDPIPPPPPNVPALEVIEGEVPTSLREKFELHRKNPECASCHAKIDPIGFALESFDGVGAWRESESHQYELPDGQTLGGVSDLKKLLAERHDDVLRSLAKNLLIYALGRGPVVSDHCTLDVMTRAVVEHDMQFSKLVTALVLSKPFRYRNNAE